jgi:flagellar basal-body rod modification protein FlgD
MDISSITGIPTVEETSLYAESGSQEVDKDAFIKMFLAQMKHQDPLNPMDGSEFAAQIAQFSSLEQLYNVNESLESIAAGQQDQTQFQTLSLIGKYVLAEGNNLSLDSEGSVKAGFELDQSSECSVTIYDENGFPVRSLSLGVLDPGRHEFEWDGENASGDRMAEGIYGFEVTAVDSAGNTSSAATHILGKINRISLDGGASTLYVGQVPVELASVLDIRTDEPVVEETSSSTETTEE